MQFHSPSCCYRQRAAFITCLMWRGGRTHELKPVVTTIYRDRAKQTSGFEYDFLKVRVRSASGEILIGRL